MLPCLRLVVCGTCVFCSPLIISTGNPLFMLTLSLHTLMPPNLLGRGSFGYSICIAKALCLDFCYQQIPCQTHFGTSCLTNVSTLTSPFMPSSLSVSSSRTS